jgi:glucose-6-phosphate 1-dehydrogenase
MTDYQEVKQLENFPTILIIFGATGDLMERKLLPAIFNLHQTGFLPKLFQVVGFAKENFTEDEYRDWLRKNLPKKNKKSETFLNKFFYQAGFFEEYQNYLTLGKRLGLVDREWRVCANKLFYLAVPPNYYEIIFKNLAKSGLTKPCGPKEGWTRVLVEKPFGQDLKRAKELDKLLAKLFKEIQVFRIDHYLAKENVQNILAFRFANSVFEDSWHKDFIEKIEIKLLEKEGVEKRGFLYDSLGALRDVGQNHLLQMLAFVTMDAPSSLEPGLIREKKLEILNSLPKMTSSQVKKDTLRAQYQGYLKIPGVRPHSQTETYFKIKTFLKHPRWKGVPIYLESGKKMGKDLVEITITFKERKPCPFCLPGKEYKNTLCFQIKPKEGITYCFFAKKPGEKIEIEKKELHFFYEESYPKEKSLPEYERLLIDAFLGDQTLFLSTPEILASWEFIDPILKSWRKNIPPLRFYKNQEDLKKYDSI